ncbi:hypothetical protein [Candidatus Reidiella endopervernicosa]|uniref:Uncharacterized protein n=1 Tax=Candidatus Reidiella endopervernicosa TaxID=2738883 RepID=A0A6N0HTL2_9GAMM|nr:hypothetical protein [Candidatus Reidiella endopervernicosa]QKQ25650.1 hypothetical protein HUE57_04590 [Candidatus Reidiella endopervernicosa]
MRNHLFAALHNSSVTLRRHKAAAASSSSSARALNYEYADGVDYRGLTAFASLSMAVSGRLHGLLLNRRNQLDCPHHRHITNHLALQPVGRLVALAESSRRRDHLLPTDGLHLYLPRPV